MFFQNKNVLASIFVLLSLGIPGPVRSDIARPAAIHELSQEDQNVRIVIVENHFVSDPCIAQSLTGHIEDKNWVVPLDEAKVLAGAPYCDAWDAGVDPDSGIDLQCAKTPAECFDCNNDQIPECRFECSHLTYRHVLDPCVPPGMVTYEVKSCNWAPSEKGEISVSNTGDDCLQPDADSDTCCDGGHEKDSDRDTSTTIETDSPIETGSDSDDPTIDAGTWQVNTQQSCQCRAAGMKGENSSDSIHLWTIIRALIGGTIVYINGFNIASQAHSSNYYSSFPIVFVLDSPRLII